MLDVSEQWHFCQFGDEYSMVTGFVWLLCLIDPFGWSANELLQTCITCAFWWTLFLQLRFDVFVDGTSASVSTMSYLSLKGQMDTSHLDTVAITRELQLTAHILLAIPVQRRKWTKIKIRRMQRMTMMLLISVMYKVGDLSLYFLTFQVIAVVSFSETTSWH